MMLTNFFHFLHRLGVDSLSFFWTPVLIWTILAAGYLFLSNQRASVGKELLRPPQLNYQILTALLLALPIGALLTWMTPFSVAAPEAFRILDTPLPADLVTELPQQETLQSSPQIFWSIYHLIGSLTLLAAAVAAWNVIRLFGETYALGKTANSIAGIALTTFEDDLKALRALLNIPEYVQVVFSKDDLVPMTFGWRNPIIIIPEKLKAHPDVLHMALMHELAHIRNADFTRRWIEKAISAVFFFHPILPPLFKQLEYLREANCDCEVLNQRGVSPKKYAKLLLDFASNEIKTPALALSMSTDENSLKKRILAMKKYQLFSENLFNSRKLAMACSLVLLAIATLIVACEVKFEKDESITIIDSGSSLPHTELPEVVVTPTQDALIPGQVFMVVEQMPELIGGIESIERHIKYPTIAKKAGIEGRVFIQFIVDTDGLVVDPMIIRGIGGGCDEEALRAVKEARFTPGRQNGQAVNVKMTLPVTFRLSDSSPAEQARAQLSDLRRMLEITTAQIQEAKNEHAYLMKNGEREAQLAMMKKMEALEKAKLEIAEKLVVTELKMKELLETSK